MTSTESVATDIDPATSGTARVSDSVAGRPAADEPVSDGLPDVLTGAESLTGGEPVGDVGDPDGGGDLLVREGDAAADYLEQLLDIVDFDGDIDLDVENNRAIVAIVGSDLSALVGPDGSTLDALQELTRLAVQQSTGVRSRLMLDVSGHRQNRRKQLAELASATARTVLDTGEAVRLAPMNPFERKVVHDSIGDITGVYSESEGEEPHRRVVVHAGD